MNLGPLIQKLAAANPNLAKNARAKQYLDAVATGDAQKGQQIAENLLKTYGKTKEEAVAEARRFFGL